jgi:alpha-tubulin suppressor-like RCC1 family protein
MISPSGGTFSGDVTIANGTNDLDIASHDGTNGLKLEGVLVTATAAELNLLDGVTSTATEINYNDISALGTAEVGKVVTSSATGDVTFVDSTNDIDIASHDGTNGLKLGGTLVTATAAELNLLDGKTSVGSNLSAVNVDILPSIDGVYDIGSTSKRFYEGHFSDNIKIGDATIKSSNSVITSTSGASFSSLLVDQILISDNLITPDLTTASEYGSQKGCVIINGNLDVDGDWLQVPKLASTIGTTSQTTGSGLNDATFAGPFTGSGGPTTYYVKITSTGTPDEFAWSKDNFSTTEATGISITGFKQDLDNGITIKFNATTGHTAGDVWQMTTQTSNDVTAAIPTQELSGIAGIIRFNESISKFEGHDGTEWGSLAETTVVTHDSGTTFKDGDIYVSSTNIAYYYSSSATSSEGIGWIALGQLQGDLATSIAAGGHHCLFLLSDGTVRSVGRNNNGQLGDGTTTNRSTPVAVSGITGCTAIAAGSGGGYDCHSLFLLSDGTVKSVGYNDYGQLGDGTTTSRSTAVAVSGITGCTAIAGGGYHSMFLLSDGNVKSVGYNNYGQLGDGSTTNRSTPVAVYGVSGWGSDCTAIASGHSHSLFLLSDGNVKSVGNNTYGQLGDHTTTHRQTPVAVYGVSGWGGATAIACGGYHSMFLLSDGTVRSVGNNGRGRLGDGTTTDRSYTVAVSSVSGCTAIAGGGSHSMFLLSDGTVKSVGDNDYGQLGLGILPSPPHHFASTAVAVSGITGCTAIAGGGTHSLFLLSDNTCKSVGMNSYGQLGDGTTATFRISILAVSGITGYITNASDLA